MLLGTVEVTLTCQGVRVFHRFDSISLPPCDEWQDDEAGRQFLPSFIFPRDPAVREILTIAQPFLRTLKDDVRAAFEGYQAAEGQAANASTLESLLPQLRSIWGALQQTCRLDYTNPPPSYTKHIQRVRTPEEILRSRRATCLELALLLASCWEHIGLYPVLFLTVGHAFTGFWTTPKAWEKFFDPQQLITNAKNIDTEAEGVSDHVLKPANAFDPTKAMGGGTAPGAGAKWLLCAKHHFALISRAIKNGDLFAVEATFVARLESFQNALQEGRSMVADAFVSGSFDGMIDVRTARQERVTPLPIVTNGIVA
jgi:hypothetical protein